MEYASIQTGCFCSDIGSKTQYLRTSVLLVGIGTLLMFSRVDAAQKVLAPRVLLSSEYHSNPLLNPNGSSATTALIVDADIRFSYNTPDASLQLRPRYRQATYEDYPQLDHKDRYLSALGEFNGPRSQFNLGMTYAEESTRVTELLDTGLVEQHIPRISFIVTPSWSFNRGEKGLFGININTVDVEYSGDIPVDSELFDYNYGSLTLSYNHLWTQRLSLLTSLHGSVYDAADIQSHSKTAGVTIGGRYAFDNYISISASFGVRQTESDYIDIVGIEREVTDEGYTADFIVNRELKNGSLSVAVSRSVVPSSSGAEYEQDKLSLMHQRKLSPRMDVRVEALYLENRILINDFFTNNRNREYAALDARLRWNMDSNWLIQAHYRNNGQRYDIASSETATSYLLGLALVYQGDKWFL